VEWSVIFRTVARAANHCHDGNAYAVSGGSGRVIIGWLASARDGPECRALAPGLGELVGKIAAVHSLHRSAAAERHPSRRDLNIEGVGLECCMP
jgi:hypothetical protein